MFYLLGNKQIIDTENLKGRNEIERFLLSARRKAQNGDKDYDVPFSELIEIHFSKILKQTNKITDLIEVGDLVKWGNEIEEVKSIDEDDIELTHCFVERDFLFERIQALYKLTNKGDFILSWKTKTN